MEGEPSLCGKLMRLDSVTAEGIMNDGCAAAVDALRTLSCHQCARDLVEEFVCAKVLPLRANQSWFVVKDDEKYRAHGLKGLSMDEKYKKVAEAVEELIEALGTAENKAIKIALADRHHVNRCFDLLGLIYPDWPSVELKDAEVGKKRKRARAGDKLTSTSK